MHQAVQAAKASGVATEIELVADVTLSADEHVYVEAGDDITISGNYTITGEDVFYVTGGKLTLAAGLNVVATDLNAIYIRGGEVITSANLKSLSTEYATIQGNGMYAGDVTINGGVMTKDLALLYEGGARAVNSREFLAEIRGRLEA